MEAHDICGTCETHQCCMHPPMLREDFARVQRYLTKPVKITDIGNGKITFPYKECPFLGDTGCIIPHEEKPKACKLFPFVFLQTGHGPPIQMLDVGYCPKWREWGELRSEMFTYWKTLR